MFFFWKLRVGHFKEQMLFYLMEQCPSHFMFIIPLLAPYNPTIFPDSFLIPCSVIINGISKEIIKRKRK